MKISRLQGYTKPKNINKHYDRMRERRVQDFFIRLCLFFGMASFIMYKALPIISEWFTNNILNK